MSGLLRGIRLQVIVCGVAIACVLWPATAATALDIPGYSATVNDRFTSGFPANPVPNTSGSFVGSAYDWSGVAWSTITDVPSPGFYKGSTMLSPRHALVAQHFHTAGDNPRILGLDGQVLTQPQTGVTNLGYGLVIGGQYDLAIATLAAPITSPANMARYAVLDLFTTTSSTTYSVYNNLSLLAYGRGTTTTASPRIGAATVLSAQLATGTNANTPVILTARSGTTPSVQFVLGDSGSPLMHGWTNPDGAAELTLLGLNSSFTQDNLYNLISMLAAPGAMQNATSTMASTGYALRVAGPTTATWVGNSSMNISNRAAWGISAPAQAPSDAYVLFNGTTAASRSVNVDANRTLRGLYFKSTASGTLGFTFSGANTLTLGRGGITNYDASRQTFSTSLALSSPQYWDVGSGGVTAAAIETNGNLLEIAGSGTARITGAVSGSGGLALSGHRLELTGTSTYSGATWGHAGTLVVDGSIVTSSGVVLDGGATLAGIGHVSGISGGGMVAPGATGATAGILTARAVNPAGGLGLSFEITGTGAPVWSNPASSTNDVVRLTDLASPFAGALTAANVINVYFDMPTVGIGNTFLGGIFTDRSGDFLNSIENAAFAFYVLGDGQGSAQTYDGQGYYALDASFLPSFTHVDVSTVAVTSANFTGGTVTNGQVMQFVVVPEPSGAPLVGLALALGTAWVGVRRARGRGECGGRAHPGTRCLPSSPVSPTLGIRVGVYRSAECSSWPARTVGHEVTELRGGQVSVWRGVCGGAGSRDMIGYSLSSDDLDLRSFFMTCGHSRPRPGMGHWLFVAASIVMLGTAGIHAADPPAGSPRAADAEAIRTAAAAYREALEKGDAAALARLWAPDGDIVDDVGNVLLGRDTASLVGETTPDEPKPEFTIVETKLRFLCADAAIEDGTVEVRLPDGGTIEGHFSAVWVRHDNAWKLSAIRESRTPEAEGSNALQELDWMVGDWKAVAPEDAPAAGGDPITMTVRWNPTRTFLIRQMRIPTPPGTPADIPALDISQQIGWDPLARQIRGWAFGTDGSHGESNWMREGDAWFSRTVSIRPDGRKTSTLTVYTPAGPDRCTVEALPTHAGGEHDPHVVLMLERTAPPPVPAK